jgi:hypothetical protein
MLAGTNTKFTKNLQCIVNEKNTLNKNKNKN